MRSWMKWGAVGGFALLAGSAFAADHADGPAAKGAAPSDINDVFAWMNAGNSNLIVAMTLGGNPGAQMQFSDQVQYVFHIGRAAAPALAAPPASFTNLVCTFTSNTDGGCYLGTPGMPSVDFVEGDFSPSAGLTSDAGYLKVHAGNHADPFFFYLGGFNAARGAVLAVAPFLTGANFEASGCLTNGTMNTDLNDVNVAFAGIPDGVTVSDYLLGQLNGTLDGNGAAATLATDNFGTNNALVIVAEITKSEIPGTGEYFHVWSSTNSN